MSVPVRNYVALTKNWGEIMQTGSGAVLSLKEKALAVINGDVTAALSWLVVYVVIGGVALGDQSIVRAIAMAAQH